MNLEFVKQVGRDNPSWLPTNLGSTCFAHTKELVRRLRAAGHFATLVCKMEGEGGYRPPGFTPRTVTGLDGKPYLCSLLSHDVIFFREQGSTVTRQFDTLASANEFDRPIYRRDGDPNWSFDPGDGPQIVASAVWNEVTSEKWRPWNPPFDGDFAEGPVPHQPAGAPGREEMMNAGRWLDAFYRAPEGLQRPHGLVVFRPDGGPEPDYEGLGAWLFDVYWNARLAGGSVDQAHAAVVTAIQGTDEWKARHR